MREENEFIETDQSMFAKAGGPYDFKATNPQKAEKSLKKVKAMRDQLDGQINHRSMALLVQGLRTNHSSVFKRHSSGEAGTRSHHKTKRRRGGTRTDRRLDNGS